MTTKKYVAGVYYSEKPADVMIVPSASMTAGGLLASTKGEIGVITQVTDKTNMAKMLGTPTDDNYDEWLQLARIFNYRVGSLGATLLISRVIGSGSKNGGLLVKTDSVLSASKPQLIQNNNELETTTVDFGTANFKFITRTPTTEIVKIAVASGKSKFDVSNIVASKNITFKREFRYQLTTETEIAVAILDADDNILEKFQGDLPDVVDGINKSSQYLYFFAKDRKIDITNLPHTFESTPISGGLVNPPVKADYLNALALFEDIEGTDINYMLANENTYNETMTLCESRKDCLFKGNVPKSLIQGVNENTALSNVMSWTSTTLPRASTFGEIVAQNLYVYDSYNKKNRWIGAGGDTLGNKIRSNLSTDVWASDAFLNRGVYVDVIAIAQRWGNSSIRDLTRNKLIPIILKRNVGFVKWSTTNFTNIPSPISHSEIRELVVFIWRSVRNMLAYYLGEQNDEITRSQIQGKVDRFLRDIKAGRGIKEYYVRCDETNNTEEVVSNNLLMIDVGCVPIFSIEEITFSIRVSSTNADLKIFANGAEIK